MTVSEYMDREALTQLVENGLLIQDLNQQQGANYKNSSDRRG
jgi:hypothetical protein